MPSSHADFKVIFSLSHNFFKENFSHTIMSEEAETIYERVAKLEDEIAVLRNEVDILKKALRNKIARYEVKMIKGGTDVESVID